MTTSGSENLDQIDVALLTALQEDGRATVQTLAERVSLSPAATSVRLSRLRERGVHRGTHAEIDERKLGYEFCAYLLLRVQDPTDRMQFTADVFKLPEVTEVAWVTGDHDVLLTCWGKTRLHLEAVIEAIALCGAHTTTMLALGDIYRKPGIAFDQPDTQPASDPELPWKTWRSSIE